MPVTIVRTPIVDDDHSGTTGTSLDNAWKQELYGQIDQALATFGDPTTSAPLPWTPNDASGANLVFSTALGRYYRVGKRVDVWGHVTYPSTVNVLPAKIGGLPFPNGAVMYQGFFVTYGALIIIHFPINGSFVHLLQPVANTAPNAIANNTLALQQVIFQGTYFTD
jgi:hypothetical protein